MPKIIENIRQRLMEEAGRQVREMGYASMTVRSVAAACGVGVGTVYNYFPSKEAMLAASMLEEWQCAIAAIEAVSAQAGHPEPVVRAMHDQLLSFSEAHSVLFQDAAVVSGFAGAFASYHRVLRSQLAAPMRRFCSSDFEAEFVAEALLTWTMAGRQFDEIYGMIGRLF